jgi:hypothetical protein
MPIAASASYPGCDALLTADLTAAINATTSPTTTKRWVDVRHLADAQLYLYVKGDNAACAAVLTFVFQAAVEPTGLGAKDLDPILVTLNGTSEIVNDDTLVYLNLRGVGYLALKSVANAETLAGRTATVNAFLKGGGRF